MYLWLKAFHIIFIVSWFAGLFYLPRLFINIQMTDSQDVKDQLNIMARKLYRFVTPFMVLVIIFGVGMMMQNPAVIKSGWFHAKLLLIFLVIIYHFSCGYFRRQLEQGTCEKSHRFFRVYNELLVIMMIGVVILAVVKPF